MTMSGSGEGGGDRAYVARRKRRKTAPAAAELNVDANGSLSSESGVAPPPLAPVTPSDPAPPPPKPVISAAGADGEDEAQEARWARLEKGIHVVGDDVQPAVYSFEAMPLPPPVLNMLHSRGLRAPTEVQAQTIPCVLRGRDVVALAATGSGKTLSYVLPLLVLAEQRHRHDQHNNFQQRQEASHMTSSSGINQHVALPFALVLVPTRELMSQVLHELLSFPVLPASHNQHQQIMSMPPPPALRPIPAIGVCGGVSVHQQVAWLQSLAHELAAIIATPGRLLHLLAMKALDLRRVCYLVIDEVDRMLETEMEHQLRQILLACSADGGSQRQTLLFSATMPHFLDRIARSAVVNAVTIRVGMGSQGTGAVASSSVLRRRDAATMEGIEQHVLFMRFAEKKSTLLEVLRSIPRPPVLVFCNSHESVEFVTRLLQSEQFHVASLHGEQTQAYRFQALEAFREGFVDVLVATDLVSRGLDFRDVDHVVIFDMPYTIEDYVHRCGRTGRRREDDDAGGKRRVGGKVTAFLTIECAIANELKKILEEAKQHVPKELELPSRFHPPTR